MARGTAQKPPLRNHKHINYCSKPNLIGGDHLEQVREPYQRHLAVVSGDTDKDESSVYRVAQVANKKKILLMF